MEVSLDNRRVVRADVFLPRIGVWTADVETDEDFTPSTSAQLVLDGALTLRGSVVRGAVEQTRWRGRLVGGAGGLAQEVPGIALRDATLASVLADALRAAGETLATGVTIDGSVPRWHRVAAPAAHAVADVARAAGLAWRVLPDGNVWLGVETWPEYRTLDAQVVDWRPEIGRVELAGDTLGVLPGQTLVVRDLSVRVGAVEHHATREALRTIVLAEPDARPAGRMLDALARLVAALTRRIDYLAHYPARVVRQRSDGALDLAPDDPRVPSCQAVPIRYGVPGVRAEVPAGARVTLTYEGGDPARPVAALWDAATVTRLRVNGASRGAAREGDVIEASSDPNPTTPGLAEWMAAVTSAVNALTPGAVGTPPQVIGEIAEGSDVVRLP